MTCNPCIGYKKCVGNYYGTYEYYSVGEIRWCSHQNKWLIINEDTIRVGIWPDPPSVLDIDKVQKMITYEASFERKCDMLAELERRLGRCGKNGELGEELKRKIKKGVDVKDDPVLIYVSGRDKKDMDYQVWLKQRRRRANRRTEGEGSRSI